MVYMKQELSEQNSTEKITLAYLKLWLKINNWMKLYIYSVLYNLPTEKNIQYVLLNLSNSFYEYFSIFYGAESSVRIKDILFNFMLAEMNVIESLKYGDKILTSERIIKWYEIADELSNYIVSINKNYDLGKLKQYRYEYIKLQIDEINAIINNDIEAQKKAFDLSVDLLFDTANYIGENLQTK